MHCRTIQRRSTDQTALPNLQWCPGHFGVQCGRLSVRCLNLIKVFFLGEGDIAHIRLAETRGRFEQSIENGVEVKSGSADDLEHVGGGGLLLECFTQFVEQPGVLDGDDGLSGEVLDQLDLLVGERMNLLVVDGDDTDQRVFLEHRNRKYCAIAAKISPSHYKRIPLAIGWGLCDIVD